MSTQRSSASEARLAVVDALLDETIGRAGHGQDTPSELTRIVLARLAAGEGEAAAARVRKASADAPEPLAGVVPWFRRQWLAAAIALLGLGVVFGVAWTTRLPDPSPMQDPVPPPASTLLVRDLDHLRTLLPQVDHIDVEVLHFTEENAPFRIDLAGEPQRLSGDAKRRILEALANDARVEPLGSWEWSNQLHLVLSSGQRIHMAVHVADPAARLTLGVRGMQGDLSVGGEASVAIREMLVKGTTIIRRLEGVVTSRADLVGPSAFPERLEELRLFGLGNDDLVHLQRFTKLRVLDCSGLQKTLALEGVRHIGRCTTLQELSLAGMGIDDPDWVPQILIKLVQLRRLDLRGVRGFTGEGFRHYINSALHRDGPREVNLSDVPTLTDDGLMRIAQWGVRDLQLAGSGDKIGAVGWRALMQSPELVRLDVSKWSMPADRVRDLAARADLQQLALDDCGLSDTDLEAIAATKSPLRRLSLRFLQSFTAKGVVALAEIPTLRELDIRRRPGAENTMDPEALSAIASAKPNLQLVR
jgi:hypothetical protein